MSKTATINQTLSIAQDAKEELIKHRRYLHQNPEIGFDLPNTVAYVEEALKKMGLDSKKVGKAGLVVTIGNGNGKTLLPLNNVLIIQFLFVGKLYSFSRKKGYLAPIELTHHPSKKFPQEYPHGIPPHDS